MVSIQNQAFLLFSVCFYVSFWTLSINDIYVPTNVYEKQIASLKQQLQAISSASGAFADQVNN